MEQIIVICPAKINLFLNILGKQNGKHIFKSINQSVDLYDYLTIKPNETGFINITINNEKKYINQENIIFKAAILMKQLYHIVYGFDIDIVKNIPDNANLGSDSTDAAGVILGIKKMFNLDIDNDTLTFIGTMISPEVPFCLFGGTCLIDGSGSIVTEVNMDLCPFLIIKPNIDLNQKEMFEAYDKTCVNYFDFGYYAIGQNDLEIVAPKEIKDIKDYMANFNAYFTNMTSSGPTVIGAFNNKEELLNAYKNLKNYFQNYQAYMVNPCKGIQILEKTRLN